MPSITKGYLVSYDPLKRQKLRRIVFLFNPNQVNVSFNPNYTFNTAAVGSTAFAQFGNASPVEISFDLFLRGKGIADHLQKLRQLCESDVEENRSAPPMAKIYLGNHFDWLNRTPVGVITSLEFDITRHASDMTPIEATAKIQFTESRIASIGV
jgi:hypothetical protein